MRGTADTSLVKQGHVPTSFNDEKSLKEFALCCDPVNGPLYFMSNFMRIQHPTAGAMQFVPYDYQVELIKSYVEHTLSVNMLGRQMGKCLTEQVNITVRNKDGDIYEMPIGVFYEYQKAKAANEETPDISCYKKAG
jgi:hypothetical protein